MDLPQSDLHGEGRLFGPLSTPRQLAESMRRAWIDFIADGSPGWAPYDLDQRATMLFGAESSVAADPFSAQRGAWTDTLT